MKLSEVRATLILLEINERKNELNSNRHFGFAPKNLAETMIKAQKLHEVL